MKQRYTNSHINYNIHNYVSYIVCLKPSRLSFCWSGSIITLLFGFLPHCMQHTCTPCMFCSSRPRAFIDRQSLWCSICLAISENTTSFQKVEKWCCIVEIHSIGLKLGLLTPVVLLKNTSYNVVGNTIPFLVKFKYRVSLLWKLYTISL